MFQANQTVYSVGTDMQCNKVVAKSTFVEYREKDEYGQDCVIADGNMKMIYKSNQLFSNEKDVVDIIWGE